MFWNLCFRLYECQEGIYSVKESLTQSNLGQHPLIKLVIISALMRPLVSSGQVWHQMSLDTKVTQKLLVFRAFLHFWIEKGL